MWAAEPESPIFRLQEEVRRATLARSEAFLTEEIARLRVDVEALRAGTGHFRQNGQVDQEGVSCRSGDAREPVRHREDRLHQEMQARSRKDELSAAAGEAAFSDVEAVTEACRQGPRRTASTPRG